MKEKIPREKKLRRIRLKEKNPREKKKLGEKYGRMNTFLLEIDICSFFDQKFQSIKTLSFNRKMNQISFCSFVYVLNDRRVAVDN